MSAFSDRPRVVVADPPWKLGDSLGARGAEANYACMTLDELQAFALPKLRYDAVLFLWRLSSMPEAAPALARAWGFRPHSEIVWEKTTKTGKPHFGMGRIVRGSHESCLIAVRGSVTQLVKSHSVRSRFAAPVGRHSEKPQLFYDIVEQLFDGPYLELFARKPRPGWTVMGDDPALQAAE